MNVYKPIACYCGRTKDEDVLMSSSSGGVFTELARCVFADGGIVIGAKWVRDEKGFRVVHSVATNESEMSKQRGSKYVVSDMSAVWPALKENLFSGRKTMFTGTPCQVAAVRKMFGDDKNLLLVSLICHANVSAEIWHTWVRDTERMARSRIVSINMRCKNRKQDTPVMTVEFENPVRNIVTDCYSSSYGKAFINCLSVRSCCCNCQFRSGKCYSDITIGDLWGVEKVATRFDDKKGVSAILCNTDKGVAFLRRLDLDIERLSYDQILQGNPRLETSSLPILSKRAIFFRYYKSHSFIRALRIAEIGRIAEFKEYYYSSRPWLVNSLPMRMFRYLRMLAVHLGTH